MIDKNNYVTVKQAVALTEKSESTIRNLIRSLTVKEKDMYLVRQGEGNKIWIRKDFLIRRYAKAKHKKSDFHQDDFIDTLKRQLDKKDIQISELTELMKGLQWQNEKYQQFLIKIGLSDRQIESIKSIAIDNQKE